MAGGLRPQAYVHNPMEWGDPLGLTPEGCGNKKSKLGCASASEALPELKGKSVPQVEKILSKNGFVQTKVSNSAAKNQTWTHPDGSEVRIHPYGNQAIKMKNGNLTPKSGLNAHVHKENPIGDQLDDLGNVSVNPNLTHIGIKNPSDYSVVRNRPHGSGS